MASINWSYKNTEDIVKVTIYLEHLISKESTQWHPILNFQKEFFNSDLVHVQVEVWDVAVEWFNDLSISSIHL